VEKDIEKLHEQMLNAAEATLKPKDAISRDFVRSEATQQLFIERQNLKDEGKLDEAKNSPKKLRKVFSKTEKRITLKTLKKKSGKI